MYKESKNSLKYTKTHSLHIYSLKGAVMPYIMQYYNISELSSCMKRQAWLFSLCEEVELI